MFKTTFSVAVLASHAAANLASYRYNVFIDPSTANLYEAIDNGIIDVEEYWQIRLAIEAGLIDEAEVADIAQNREVRYQIRHKIRNEALM